MVISKEFDEVYLDNLVDELNDEQIIYLSIEDSINQILDLKKVELIHEKEELVKHKLKIFNENMEQWVMEFNFDEDYHFAKNKMAGYNSAIRKSLTNSGINLVYDYQLIKEDNDTTIVISSSTDDTNILIADYKTDVYPDDIFTKGLYLIISFPDKNSHIYKNVSLLVGGSVIFTIIILLTFGTTLYYIRNKKK